MKRLSEYILESYDETLSDILENILDNDDFLEDNYGALEDVHGEKQQRIRLIDGYCIEVCMFVSYYELDDVDYYVLDDGGSSYHFFMKQNNLYYDAYNYRGVKKLKDLEFVKMYMNKYSENELMKHLTLVGSGDFDYNKAIKIKNEKKKK